MNPLESIIQALQEGWQATKSAGQEDWSNIQEGRMPQNALKALGDIFMTYQNPSMGAAIPNIPTYFNPFFEHQKQLLENYGPQMSKQLEEILTGGMTPQNLAAAIPTGERITPITSLVQSLRPQYSDPLTKLLQMFSRGRAQLGTPQVPPTPNPQQPQPQP